MNRQIIVAVVIISGTGIVNAMLNQKAVTPIIIGSYVLLLLLAIADAVGGPFSQVWGAIALLAATVVVFTEFPLQQVISLVQGKKA